MLVSTMRRITILATALLVPYVVRRMVFAWMWKQDLRFAARQVHRQLQRRAQQRECELLRRRTCATRIQRALRLRRARSRPRAPHPIARVQAVMRGWYVRRVVGPLSQAAPPRTGVAVRVCGANSCCQRGADEVKVMIEDLCPPSTVLVGSIGCFALCSAGPNVSCSRNGSERPSVHHRVEGLPAVRKMLLRSVGLRVHPALAAAAKLREAAAQHLATHPRRALLAAHAAADGAATLDGAAGGVLACGVVALRLRHRLLLLHADAAKALCDGADGAHGAEGASGGGLMEIHRSAASRLRDWSEAAPPSPPPPRRTDDDDDDDDVMAHARTRLACALEAMRVQSRLARAHAAGPHRLKPPAGSGGGPRFVPALLHAAHAHVALGDVKAARALLEGLRAPPFEPPATRAHRVRVAERRAAEELLASTTL